MNYSVAIDNTKYERNTLLFAIGFLLDSEAECEMYEPVLRKLSKVLIYLELEKEYLFLDTQKVHLQAMFATLYQELVDKKEAFLKFDNANYLCVQLFSSSSQDIPLVVHDYDVPIFVTRNPSALSNLPWDISLLHMVPHIDGFSSAHKISVEAAMDIVCVKSCLRVLQYYGCIVIGDIFQFSNCYHVTERVAALLAPGDTLAAVCAFAAVDVAAKAPPTEILHFTFALRPHVSIGELLLTPGSKAKLRGVDVRKLLAILQSFQIIRRVRKYPCSISNKNPELSFNSLVMAAGEEERAASGKGVKSTENMFTGAQHVEEIVVSPGNTKTASEILKYSHVLFINK